MLPRQIQNVAVILNLTGSCAFRWAPLGPLGANPVLFNIVAIEGNSLGLLNR